MPAFTGNSYLYAGLGGLHIGDILVQLICFILILYIAKKFAWGPIMDMMKRRQDYVTDEIEAAEESRKDAARLLADAEERLNATKQDAQKIIEDARTLAAKQEQEIVQAARTEAERLKKAAQADIQQEKEKAVQALQDQVASLSVLIASKVIEKELTEQDQDRLIGEYVKQLGDQK